VGFILSANRFTRILANAPAGSLVDRVGTRTPLIVGLFVETVATAGYVVALDAPLPETWFLLARVVWGVGSALVFATAYTIAADVSDSGSRGTSMGVVRGGITLGFPAGLVLGGVVSDGYGVSTAFLVAAGFALVATLVAYAMVPETHVSETRTTVRPWELDDWEINQIHTPWVVNQVANTWRGRVDVLPAEETPFAGEILRWDGGDSA
jgi:MFS family permease